LNRVITCVTLNEAIRRAKMINIIERIRAITYDIIYVFGLVLAAVVLIPFVLLMRGLIEIRAAVQHGQIAHHQAKPVYS
jgi:hypothetical protein